MAKVRVDLRNAASIWKYRGERVVEGGYVLLWVEAEGCYRGEHRLVVEAALGRRLRTEEHVHHVNGKRADNSKGNLIVCNPDYHSFLDAIQRLKRHPTYTLGWQRRQWRTISIFFHRKGKLSSSQQKILRKIEAYITQRGTGKGTRK